MEKLHTYNDLKYKEGSSIFEAEQVEGLTAQQIKFIRYIN